MRIPRLLPRPVVAAAAAALVLHIEADGQSRTWTSNDGKTLEAEFLRIDGDAVVVNRGGRTIEIPLDRLSEEDRQWVAEQAPDDGASTDASGQPDDTEIARVTELLERSLKSADLSDEERAEVAAFVARLLPDTGGAGEPVEWKVSFPKWGGDSERDSVLLTADLYPKGGAEDLGERLMWFHIVFFGKEKKSHSPKTFGRFPAMRFEDRHLFLTVKRTDVRGVADAESYQDDTRIDAVMKGIDLETIAKL